MKRISVFATVLIGTILLGLTSCRTPEEAAIEGDRPTPTETQAAAPDATDAETSEAEVDEDASRQSFSTIPNPSEPTAEPAPSNALTLDVYKANPQCTELVSEATPVSADSPVSAAVGKVLATQNTGGQFDLSGYRVSVDPSGVATVDFRLDPDSMRRFVSLSACEQFALFGSIRETLTQNPQLQVESVRFTNRGEEIVL